MPTASRFVRLAGILEKPFGPFTDADALTPKCKSTPMNPLQLESLEMHATYAGERRRVGLDMTQTAVIFPADPKPEEVAALKRLYPVNVRHLPAIPAKTPIEFTGVLVLANTKHIQEDVSEAIQDEIRRRLRQAKVASHGNPWTEVLFAEDGRPLRDDPKLRVRILIRGNIHKPASFNVASPDGNGRILRISTLDRSRSYRVVSMHVATYDLSRTYLLRWRVQAAIEDIYTEDRKKRKGKGKGKDTAHLTPQFYIDQYLRRHRKHFEDILRWRRTLGLPGADEPAPGTEEPPLEAEAYPLGTLTLTPRSMRHVHRFEIAHCFGAHVEWLIAQAHARRQVRALDWESWLKFADVTLEERKNSALARRDEFNGNEANPGPLPERETRIDLRALLDSRGKLERARASAGNAMEVDSEEEDVGFDIFMESESEESDDFDSDHYETSPSEHSSDDEGIEPWHGLSPEMDAVLHPSFFVPPHLGDDFMYDCFVDGCDFHVNLRFLSEEDTHALEPGWWTHYHPSAVEPGKVAIRAKQQFLQRVLSRLVAKHYFVHLRELGIKMVQKKGLGLVPEWLHPERHEEWPPRHLLEARAYHNSL